MKESLGYTGILVGFLCIFFGAIMTAAGTNSILTGTSDHHLSYDWFIAIMGAGLIYSGYYMIRRNRDFTLRKMIEILFDGPIAP